MAHFAEIDDKDTVLRVIVAEQDFIDSGSVGDPAKWIQTSYNTVAGVHRLGGEPLRKNYAGIGYTYDRARDAFIPPKPYVSWHLDPTTCTWLPPIPMPENRPMKYKWDENIRQWVLREAL